MKIVVVGAAGMVGPRVVAEAAHRGHDPVAVFRNGRPVLLPSGVVAVQGDANDRSRISEISAGADAVVVATRPVPGQEHTVAASTHTLLDVAAAHGIRVLVVGGAAPLRNPAHPERLVLDSPEFVPEPIRTIAGASVAQLEACRAHPADWVYLSPPAVLEPAARTGKYRRGTTTLVVDAAGNSRISADDLAVAIVDEVENSGGVRHFTVGY
ncbi:NAD(P)-dependent oxidoreductase [Nocardia grenadensis]|uniref:NAD(P)-dependent oxidoreductase n=1 Tax=Nocardia grenadensis TaxID=931537 RepID=UPI003D8F7284